MVKLFDAHCHLQDPRILKKAPKLIQTSLTSGVSYFAVNGVSESDWDSVKQLSDTYPSVIPNFGIHPWYVAERTPNWFSTLKQCFQNTPSAAVGEIGLDKGTQGREVDFMDQVEVFRLQLELAKELKRPASVHCVRAFGDLLDIMKGIGPFPSGVILHSYMGSAEMVPEFSELGAYFSFSGHNMSMKEQKARKMIRAVPSERILLESDAPDALPKTELESVFLIEGYTSISQDTSSTIPKETLNHPANIHSVLMYVGSLLEISREDLAELSYRNAVRLFSYENSKLLLP